MTSKERVLSAIKREKTDRVPWVPFVGCHAAALIEKTATEYMKSADLVEQGLNEAIKRYRPDGIPVSFDLQIEAEIFGCDLAWADDNPPAVTTHPLTEGVKLEDLVLPEKDQGRLPVFLEATKRLRATHPDIALYGLITGPFTLALHLYGSNIFMTMFDDPAYVKRLIGFCGEVAERVAGFYLEAGCDIVAVVDPMTSQIGPEQFNEFVTPSASSLFKHIESIGGLSSFFVCGHAQQNVQVMCECKPDNVSVDENIPLDFVREVCLTNKVSFGGNLQLTAVLLLGSEVESQKNAIACIETGGTEGFILAPGCDLPYAVPPENLEAITAIVEDEYQREVVKNLAVEEGSQELLDMSDYGQSDKIIVDIITLDSEACAPCQYMVESVQQITPEFDGIVEWREHKIKYKESLVFMTSLMVRNIPTICIDGQITFVSRIPAREELVAALQKRILEKIKIRIKRKSATINILGINADDIAAVRKKVEAASQELGSNIEINEVTDEDTILSYGVLPQQTPAVVVSRHTLKSTKNIPEVSIVKEWIKELQ